MSKVFVACLIIAFANIFPVSAQEPFVIVPDRPPVGGGGGGIGGGNAVATANLNLRSGPGTRYRVIDILQRGQTVRVSSCQGGWCRVNASGLNGWAAQNYLARVGTGGGVRPVREVCFFEETRFRGRSFCALPGDSQRDLGSWRNRIASISVRGFPTVQVCVERNFNDCDAFNEDVPVLPWWLEGQIASFRVFH